MNLYLRYKDNLKRKNFHKKYIHIFFFKSLLINQNLPYLFRVKIMLLFQNYLNNNYFSKIKNRSIESNISRSVSRFFNLSKTDIRTHFRNGNLNGFKKSVW